MSATPGVSLDFYLTPSEEFGALSANGRYSPISIAHIATARRVTVILRAPLNWNCGLNIPLKLTKDRDQ